MIRLKLFEEFKIKKFRRIYKHLNKGKGGAQTILSNISFDKDTIEISDKRFSGSVNVLGSVLKSISKRFELKKNIKYINSGSYGMAFVINDKVIKLTSNKNEAMIAKSFIGKKINHCVNYYDIVYIKRYNIYAILMDRAEKLSSDEKKVISKLINNAIFMNDFPKLKSKFDSVSENKLKKIYTDFKKMYKSLKDDNISIQDLHEGNIGYLNGKMVHYDIMSDTSKNDIDKISKIKI
jgi:hypothetical protein